MKDEVEELWFKPYDEESFLRNFCDVNYQRYLLVVVTDPNFQWFNATALQKKRYWDSGSVVFFDLLDILSDFFDLDTLDERLMYVEDTHARKLPVKFKFWVDTEKLYLLLFMGMDDILFNEQRLLASMLRFKRAVLALFEVYKPSMFQQGQFGKFMYSLKQQVLTLQKTFNQRKENLVSLAKEIVIILNRVQRGEKISEREIQNELFRRISKEVMHYNTERIKVLEERLYNATVVPQRIDTGQENNVWALPSLSRIVAAAKEYYDPERLDAEERARLEKEERLVRRRNFLQVGRGRQMDSKSKSIDKRDKDRMSTRTRFNLHRVLQRSGNYPYSFQNILYNDFHDDLVRVKDDKKQNSSHDSDRENDLLDVYYEQEYMNKLRAADRDYAKVAKTDIVQTNVDDRHHRHHSEKTPVTDIQWIDFEDIPKTRNKINDYQQEDTDQQQSLTFNDDSDDEGGRHSSRDSEDELAKGSTLKNYLLQQKKAVLKQCRVKQQSRQHFNVYQSKHSRDTVGWGLIRSLYNDSKVHRKMSTFLKEVQKYYYYINRLEVQEKRKVVV